MALLNALSGSIGSGGSINSSRTSSWSNTNGTGATVASNQQAATANSSALQAWQEAANFNAEQARIQREWQERMTNSTYQRTVADMKKAGINPILASGLGLSADSVGSGASASMSSPDVFMGHAYADQNSASNSYSNGSSWQNSESGLATGLKLLGDAISSTLGALNSSQNINIALNGLDKLMGDNAKTGDGKTVAEHKKNGEYKKSVGTTFREVMSNPKGLAQDILNYVTFKSSGGTLSNHK